MGFFNRKKDDVTITLSNVLVSEVYFCKVYLASNYDDGSGLGPQCVDFYLLAKLENEKYSELFSGKNLEMEKDCHKDRFTFKNLNTIYIEEVKPLSDYLINESLQLIDIQDLFDFIVNYNVLIYLDSLDEKEKDISDSDD